MATKPEYTLDYSLDPTTRKLAALELTRVSLRSRVGLTFMVGLVALAIFFSIAIYIEDHDLSEALRVGLPFIAIALAFILGIYLISRMRLKEIAKKFPDLHFEFYDTYLLNRTPDTEGKINYNVLDQLIVTRAGYSIRIARQYFFLPTSQVSPELAAFLKSKISSRPG